MIHNLTKAEWEALTSAIAVQLNTWEQDGDDYGHSATRLINALNRAYAKTRQLAPEAR